MSAFTVFDGPRRLATGSRVEAALEIWRARRAGSAGPLFAFDDSTGGEVDFDLSGSEEEIAERLADKEDDAPRGRGRPKLGVVAREVTLLPRHWEWLAAQSGGASVALRRLVDEARRRDGGATEARRAKSAAFRFLTTMAGDMPGFEEAIRALFADDSESFARHALGWPPDVTDHAARLAFGPPGSGS
jgi:hypothetical protein